MRSQVKLRSSDFHPLMSPKGQERILRNHRSMSALPPKADIGTGPRITFDAASPAAWRYAPQSAAPHHGSVVWLRTLPGSSSNIGGSPHSHLPVCQS